MLLGNKILQNLFKKTHFPRTLLL